MASDWLTPGVVRSSAGLPPGDTYDEEAMTMAADAAAEFVEGLPGRVVVDETTNPRTVTVGPLVLLGAAMLANRWYARRSSPLGIIGYAELGGVGIMREDPDIARLLGIGQSRAFVFGAPTPDDTTTTT